MEEFTKSNIKHCLNDINDNVTTALSDIESLFTLPIDTIRNCMDNEDFKMYIETRQKLINVLNLLDVFIYDTHEEKTLCFECNNTEAKVVSKFVNGVEVEAINGDIEHWITNGKIHHIFICDECIKRKRGLF